MYAFKDDMMRRAWRIISCPINFACCGQPRSFVDPKTISLVVDVRGTDVTREYEVAFVLHTNTDSPNDPPQLTADICIRAKKFVGFGLMERTSWKALHGVVSKGTKGTVTYNEYPVRSRTYFRREEDGIEYDMVKLTVAAPLDSFVPANYIELNNSFHVGWIMLFLPGRRYGPITRFELKDWKVHDAIAPGVSWSLTYDIRIYGKRDEAVIAAQQELNDMNDVVVFHLENEVTEAYALIGINGLTKNNIAARFDEDSPFPSLVSEFGEYDSDGLVITGIPACISSFMAFFMVNVVCTKKSRVTVPALIAQKVAVLSDFMGVIEDA